MHLSLRQLYLAMHRVHSRYVTDMVLGAMWRERQQTCHQSEKSVDRPVKLNMVGMGCLSHALSADPTG